MHKTMQKKTEGSAPLLLAEPSSLPKLNASVIRRQLYNFAHEKDTVSPKSSIHIAPHCAKAHLKTLAQHCRCQRNSCAPPCDIGPRALRLPLRTGPPPGLPGRGARGCPESGHAGAGPPGLARKRERNGGPGMRYAHGVAGASRILRPSGRRRAAPGSA